MYVYKGVIMYGIVLDVGNQFARLGYLQGENLTIHELDRNASVSFKNGIIVIKQHDNISYICCFVRLPNPRHIDQQTLDCIKKYDLSTIVQSIHTPAAIKKQLGDFLNQAQLSRNEAISKIANLLLKDHSQEVLDKVIETLSKPFIPV